MSQRRTTIRSADPETQSPEISHVTPRYLIRFDDICPTMNWLVWEQIEPVLHDHGIRPIVAVVPDNRDPKLKVGAPAADFWRRVRKWQAAGWCVALHGFQHHYVTGDAGLVGINAYSEFAGLPGDEQREKLRRALAIFDDNGVRADAWVAPAHSFDELTVEALLELGIDTISDGFFFRPVRLLGARWLPQQLWHFRPMPAGLWTICLHCNGYSDRDIAALRASIARFAAVTTSVADVLRDDRLPRAGWVDLLFARSLPVMQSLRRRMRGR